MTALLRAGVVALHLVCLVFLDGGLGLSVASAQLPPDPAAQPPRRGGLPQDPQNPGGAMAPLNNDEVYRMFDMFVMTQAQMQLQLADPQFTEFFRRMTHLQNVQRRHRNQRQRVLVEIRRLVAPGIQVPDETAIAARIRELDDVEAQHQMEERQALGAIDVILQPPQRAHFRIFLENMERRKVELLMRARQGGPPPAARGGRAGQAPIR